MSSPESADFNLHHWTSEDQIQVMLKQQNIYIAHKLINSSHQPRIKSMSIWVFRISTGREAGHAPTEEVGVRF